MRRREKRMFPAWICPNAPSSLKDVGVGVVVMMAISAAIVVIRHLFE